MEEDRKAYYTINEFAKLLKVHPNTIRNSIKSGRIIAFKVGYGIRSVYRISSNEIQRMIIIDLEKRNKIETRPL